LMVTVMGDAAGVAAGVVVIATVVLPVTVRLSVPLAEAVLYVSPKKCALMAWVPTDKAGAVGVAVPPDTAAAVPIIVPPSNSWTMPEGAGVPPVTETLNVKGVPEGSLPTGTVSFVTVADCVMPPPPPPPP